MGTIYELLEVDENASKEEIEKAYSKLVLEFRQDIKFDDEKNKENEMIVNKLKLAYEILIDDEKRKKYDYQLAQSRAENLIQNLTIKQEEIPEPVSKNEHSEKIIKNKESNIEQRNIPEKKEEFIESDILSENEKKQIRKAAEKEFKQKLKKVKQAEEEYNEAYNKAYSDYMRKMGYKVKASWTFKRIKRLVIAIVVLILICFILWNIASIKNILLGLYQDNFFVKGIVDIIKSLTDTIKTLIEVIFKNKF